MRRFLERIARGRSFVRYLPRPFDKLPIIVSPDAQLKCIKPGHKGFDEHLINAAFHLVREGDNVWDIGANVGVFTMASAALSRTGQIVAIEADTWLVELIRKTIQLPENRKFDIAVIAAAAFSSVGIAKFAIAMRGRASSHLETVRGNSQTGGYVKLSILLLYRLTCF